MIVFSKSLFFNMPSGEEDKGNLSLWRHDNTVIAGKTLLYNYTGSDWKNTIYVPKVNGNAIINEWVNVSSSGSTDANRQTPFYNNQSVTSVDLQYVPFVNNSMFRAFLRSENLTEVFNINNNITNMSYTFGNCSNFNQNITLPNSVTDMRGTFSGCIKFNQGITIPNSVTRIGGLTSSSGCFSGCNSLGLFSINILSTEIKDAGYAFPNNSTKRRSIYIYYKYANGVFTNTYNTFNTAATYYANGATGSTNLFKNTCNNYIYNAGRAPW